MELYKDTMKYHRSGLYFHGLKNDFDNYCYSPCLFHSINAIKTNQFDRNMTSMVYMKLKENINIIESYHLYSTLSLIAEIGGYVGLFLGVSINQVSVLINVVIDKACWMFTRKRNFNG